MFINVYFVLVSNSANVVIKLINILNILLLDKQNKIVINGVGQNKEDKLN